jgi:hypothetical protein
MVKNTGGNKSKKVARKNVGGGSMSSTQDVRRVADPCEMYAAVLKIYSSRRCDVMGSDGKTYQCTVRGKFLKSKRGSNSALVPGVWIIIGFYDWEVRSDGAKTCDLLEIYSPMEKDKLKQLEAHNLTAIMNVGELEGSANELTFSKFKEQEEEDEMESSADEEEIKAKPKVVEKKKETLAEIMAVQPQKKQTIAEEMDWLNIDVRDI